MGADRASQRAGVVHVAEEIGMRADELAAEEPLEVRLNGEPLTVIMRTPGHDADLVSGFLFGEGIIRATADMIGFRVIPNGEHPQLENIVDVTLAPGAPGKDSRWQRHFFAASSCGLCGVSSIDAVHRQAPPIEADDLRLAPEVIFSLEAKLRAEQAVFALTGGLHAAGLFTAGGDLIVARE